MTALLLEILHYFQTSKSSGGIASPCRVGVARFGEPDLRGGNRVDAMLKGRVRCAIVNPPITPLEPPVDGRREPKTQRQEGKDFS
jgi:hypothetical protein